MSPSEILPIHILSVEKSSFIHNLSVEKIQAILSML